MDTAERAANALVDDYTDPFDPDFALSRLSRATLSMVARELMLGSHIQDRSGIPAVLAHHSMDEANDVAINEWMVTSPAYTRRMQRLMGFEGTGMSTIYKGLQLDMGFPHQFLDVGYRLHDEAHGEFWLRSCGALADVAPMGHEMVKGMCHDIEDPTFDATAIATNARAQVRPLHRPPEVPKGGPDCHWTVTISPDHPEVDQHPRLDDMLATNLTAMPNDPPPSAEPGGWEDYSGPFDPHFELEDLSHRALALVATEFALQGHMLARGFMMSVEERWGLDQAIDMGTKLFTGVGWIESERLLPVLGLDTTGVESIAKVMQVHHILLLRDYLGLRIGFDGEQVRVGLAADSPAMAEGDVFSVAGLLDVGGDSILESIAWGVNPRAQVERIDAGTGERAAWTVSVDESAEPASEPQGVEIVRISNGPRVVFLRRRPLRR